jgi:hypothetical protein
MRSKLYDFLLSASLTIPAVERLPRAAVGPCGIGTQCACHARGAHEVSSGGSLTVGHLDAQLAAVDVFTVTVVACRPGGRYVGRNA